jgi:hypothetical protein
MREDILKTIKINNTRIWPLRWLANICGSISTKTIMRLWRLHDEDSLGFRYKVYGAIHKVTWPIYSKYGTFYKVIDDLGGEGWNDYDENGHPYWYYTEWQEDPETGDAWKLKYKEKNNDLS